MQLLSPIGRLILLSCLLAGPARADDAILILDASKSMWGHVQGKSKVEIARQVVTQLLTEIPADRRLGFVAYGHRRASDCNDIEQIVPVGSDRKAIQSSLEKLDFRGKTPLTAAVRFAADRLRYTEQKATVILVSDGIESCMADPCAAGADLEKAGVDLTVHVVGFGLAKKGEAKGLKCLADATGGKYFSANNAAELTKALQQTVADKPATPETEVGGVATISAPASVAVGSKIDLRWTGPNNDGDWLTVISPDIGDGNRTDFVPTYRGDGTAKLDAPLVPGTYELRYTVNGSTTLARRKIEVTQVTATISGPSQVPAGSTFDVRWTGPNYDGDWVTIISPDIGDGNRNDFVSTYHGDGTARLEAPLEPGVYELRYALKGTRTLARQKVEITPVTATISGPSQVAAGSKFDVRWTGPKYESDWVTIVRADISGANRGDSAATQGGNGRSTLQAPDKPGGYAYELRYVLQGRVILAKQAITVRPP